MSPSDINPTLLDFDLPSQVVAKVAVLAPVAEVLDYVVPDGMTLEVGDHVMVPLAHHKVRGVVASVAAAGATHFKLKAIVAKIDDPPVPRASLEFWLWAAGWTLTPPGVFLNGCIGALKTPKAQMRQAYVLTGTQPVKLTKARERVLEQAVMPLSLTELSQGAGVSPSVIKGLEAEGVLARIDVEAEAFAVPDPQFKVPMLNPSQAAADALLAQKQAAGGFCPVLLDGVTGSGKTEVYLESVARTLSRDPKAQVLILLPEIALTQAVMARLKARFGADPVPWHSALTPSQRRKIWEGVASGEVRLVVGARSALFLPYQKLDLIVVDEEHDGSYKQEDGVRYQARDLAVVRAHRDKFMIILASATPSLESLSNAQKGRYEWIRLTERHGTAQLPDIHLIDMKAHPPGKTEMGDPLWLSAPLVAEIERTLARKEQVLLFLNRRGYAPLVLCRACGERMTAPNTDSWLVEHRATGRLVCHLTGFSMKKPDRCPHCGALDSLAAIGPGVERILEEVQSRFSKARAEIFSSDTTPDAASSEALIRRVQDHQTDILIATQAAAKGHNFLNLTLVGIVDADLGLKGGDLRAAERTFQLLAQATGRAGRAHKAGKALLQTYSPEHPVMQALKAQDRDAFYAYEQMTREITKFPPFGRLAAVIMSSKDQAELNRFSRELALTIPNTDGVEVYGPADAPLSLVRGQWRKRFLVRADRNRDLQGFMAAWLRTVKKPNIIRMVTDIDPYSFL
ncbi:primosomal protein N' [Asticcacaulis machinosus]|uniref:Replication restart protein PriA n=1 Tax=Asticcacaulis machinosus TaxID=2984211 RepID=A0ABT5HL05_9CAUL|nr:primosomal protein N' [Asticcacaulis machinosus]MDC7676924.1 primosomal protein N' [Asticcacaulis machinosus]